MSAGTGQRGFWAVLKAELSRIWTLPWTLLLITLTGLVSLVPAWFAGTEVTVYAGGQTTTVVTQSLGLTLAVNTLIMLTAVGVGSDLRSGELSLALIAVPQRIVLAAAKLGAQLTLVFLVSGTVFLLDGTVRIFSDPAAGWHTADVEMWRVGGGFVMAAVTFCMLSAAVTMLLGNVMVAVAVLVLPLLLVVPWLEQTAPLVSALLPYNAQSAVIARSVESASPASLSAGFAILLAWTVISAATYAIVLRTRE